MEVPWLLTQQHRHYYNTKIQLEKEVTKFILGKSRILKLLEVAFAVNLFVGFRFELRIFSECSCYKWYHSDQVSRWSVHFFSNQIASGFYPV